MGYKLAMTKFWLLIIGGVLGVLASIVFAVILGILGVYDIITMIQQNNLEFWKFFWAIFKIAIREIAMILGIMLSIIPIMIAVND